MEKLWLFKIRIMLDVLLPSPTFFLCFIEIKYYFFFHVLNELEMHMGS